jgi:hypothetical protein
MVTMRPPTTMRAAVPCSPRRTPTDQLEPLRLPGPESSTVVSVPLAAVDGQPQPVALPGQFVVLRLRLPDEQQSAVRSYSLSGAPGAADYRVNVKREQYGIASAFIHTGLAAGALVEMSASRGAFILDDGSNPVLPEPYGRRICQPAGGFL